MSHISAPALTLEEAWAHPAYTTLFTGKRPDRKPAVDNSLRRVINFVAQGAITVEKVQELMTELGIAPEIGCGSGDLQLTTRLISAMGQVIASGQGNTTPSISTPDPLSVLLAAPAPAPTPAPVPAPEEAPKTVPGVTKMGAILPGVASAPGEDPFGIFDPVPPEPSSLPAPAQNDPFASLVSSIAPALNATPGAAEVVHKRASGSADDFIEEAPPPRTRQPKPEAQPPVAAAEVPRVETSTAETPASASRAPGTLPSYEDLVQKLGVLHAQLASARAEQTSTARRLEEVEGQLHVAHTALEAAQARIQELEARPPLAHVPALDATQQQLLLELFGSNYPG